MREGRLYSHNRKTPKREVFIEQARCKARRLIEDGGQRVEILDGAAIRDMWAFNAEGFGLTVDAFAGSPLVIDHLVERAGAVQRDTSEATCLGVDIFDTALAEGLLSMVAGLAGWFGM